MANLKIKSRHRLFCGDSTKQEDVDKLFAPAKDDPAPAKADLLLTDPPYNVDYTGKTKDALKIDNDSMSDDQFRLFLKDFLTQAFDHMNPGAAFYIWHADSEGYNFRGAVRDCKQKVRQCLIWAKDVMVMGRQDYHWQHEPCLYGWKDGGAHNWYTDRTQTTLLKFNRPSRSEEHPTMKPVELFSYLIDNSSKKDDLIYDPFLGSGTSLVAAQNLNRKCYGIEISPSYCAVILERMKTAFPTLEIRLAE